MCEFVRVTLENIIKQNWKLFPSLTSSLLVIKREILHDSAQIYDPFGLITPFTSTIKAKLFLQALWKRKIDWSKPLNQESYDK